MVPDIPTAAHGGQLRQIAAQYGIPVERLLDFSANINPAGPPSSVLSAIRRALDEPSTLAMYPDLELVELKTAVAEYTGTQRENIAVANGFVPLLDAALRSLKIKRCLLPVPSFREYRNTLENAGVSVTPYRSFVGRRFSLCARCDPECFTETLLRRNSSSESTKSFRSDLRF